MIPKVQKAALPKLPLPTVAEQSVPEAPTMSSSTDELAQSLVRAIQQAIPSQTPTTTKRTNVPEGTIDFEFNTDKPPKLEDFNIPRKLPEIGQFEDWFCQLQTDTIHGYPAYATTIFKWLDQVISMENIDDLWTDPDHVSTQMSQLDNKLGVLLKPVLEQSQKLWMKIRNKQRE